MPKFEYDWLFFYKAAVSTIRLVGGTSKYSGRVEVNISSRWGTVCDDGFTNASARVVCRMLNFPTYVYNINLTFNYAHS